MEKENELYGSPRCHVITVENNAVICASPLNSGDTQPIYVYGGGEYGEDDWN